MGEKIKSQIGEEGMGAVTFAGISEFKMPEELSREEGEELAEATVEGIEEVGYGDGIDFDEKEAVKIEKVIGGFVETPIKNEHESQKEMGQELNREQAKEVELKIGHFLALLSNGGSLAKAA
jgi:hypothetical protein